MNCLLCHTPSHFIENEVFSCSHCRLIFKNPKLHLNSVDDIKRYSTHQNNEHDQGYIDFLNRLVIPLKNFLPEHFSALDFGCGPGPTLALLLTDEGGNVLNYDPLFFNNQEALKNTYDVVATTEVVEHFKRPEADWSLLISLVKPNGLLAVMTQFVQVSTDYPSWWYKNDPTHVVFYSEETFSYLAKRFQLEILYNDKHSVIIFRKQ